MDSFEWNKIIGAVLGTILFVMVVHISSQAVIYAPPPNKPGYVVPGVEAKKEESAPAPAAPVAEQVPDWASAITAADVMAGEMIAERCGACHDWTKGGPNKIGPNLYSVVGRPRASAAGFEYSPAMKMKGGTWTYDELFQFLRQPASFVPGTKMTFAGLPKPQDRVNVMAFLRMQADSPAPLPPAK
jgi:cytochrome c